jgi:hypothetical protein
LSERRAASRTHWLLGVWLAFGVTAMILACWGWYLQSGVFRATNLRRIENAVYMTLRVFSLSDAYTNASNTGGRWQLVVARWMGAAVFLSGVATAGVALFQAQLASLAASWRRRHVLIIGDHDMAFALAREALKRRLPTIHLTATVSSARRAGSLISLPRAPGDEELSHGRAGQAARVIIAESDLGESVEHALEVAARLGAGPSPPSVAVHLEDPAMAEGIHHVEGGIDLFAFSEAHAVARSIMLRHPPLLLADLIGASAVHVLILGFDGLGQELARDVALNAVGMNLRRPRITVIDQDAAFVKRGFLHRHPEFPRICNFEVFAHLEEAAFGSPQAVGESAPAVCASYVCLRDSAVALAAAIGLRESAIRHDGIRGPIFTRLRSGGLMRPPGGVRSLQPLILYGFGGLVDSSSASRALLADPDEAAKAVHQNYSRIGGASAGPWEQLSEDMRVSNRRVAGHIPTKLAALGFDLEPWLALPDDERPWPPPLAPGVPLCRDAAERTRLAILEHERWMADRRLNGWRPGPTRDNARKIHTDLVPFDDLSEAVKGFDYAVVDWLDTYLPRRSAGLERPASLTPDSPPGSPGAPPGPRRSAG